MWFKEKLKQDFKNEKKINLLRLNAVKILLVFSIFLFFINFFILWTNIKFNLFKLFLPFSYFFLLISMLYYFYFLLKVKVSYSKIFLYLIFFLLLNIFFLLLLPFVFKNWLIDVLNFFSNLF